MKDAEILMKAVEKAIENGWLPYGVEVDQNVHVGSNSDYDNVIVSKIAKNSKFVPRGLLVDSFVVDMGSFFTEKSLAKAFFGEEEYRFKQCFEHGGYVKFTPCDCFKLPNWQYHLQQMVIKEEPIKYLEQFL